MSPTTTGGYWPGMAPASRPGSGPSAAGAGSEAADSAADVHARSDGRARRQGGGARSGGRAAEHRPLLRDQRAPAQPHGYRRSVAAQDWTHFTLLWKYTVRM